MLLIVFTARRYASAVYAVVVRVSVCRSACLSVHLSVCHQPALYHMVKRRITQTAPYDSAGTLVFWRRKCRRNSDGVTPNGGSSNFVCWLIQRCTSAWMIDYQISNRNSLSPFATKIWKRIHAAPCAIEVRNKDGTGRQRDGRTSNRFITLAARPGQRNKDRNMRRNT